MIPRYLSVIWMAIAPALGNHLWQSTLCIVIAGLLTLVLRKNHARARYGLWLAASVKFLVPFSLLIAIGSHLARPRALPSTERGFFFAMEEVGQPFTKAAAGSQAAEKSRGPAQDAGLRYRLVHLLPAVLVALWLSGFMTVLFVWYARWRRVSVAMRDAAPLREGHEVEALRRAERLGGVRKPLELLLSPVTLEPGIFGIVKPVLVWPKGLSERLDDALLEAILAHEVWHVRRRDNLTATIHMAVEAFFWFHPLVWWLGSRLMEERERACDEEVLESGGERQVYAESILRTCEFCVESPLACVSGVTGADLKKRIVRIMTERMANKLSFGRKLLLTAIGIAVISGPVVFGLANAPRIRAQSPPTTNAPLPSFEVASIKPNRSGDARLMTSFRPSRFTTTGTTIKRLIALAHNVNEFQVSGGPGWISSEKYDIEAKESDSLAGELEKLPRNQQWEKMGLMIQSLLADRFELKVRHETRDLPVYALVVAKGGPKFLHTKFALTDPFVPGKNPPPQYPAGMGGVKSHESMGQLASWLSRLPDVGRPVLDQTGLGGTYYIELQWARDQTHAGIFNGPEGGKPGTDNAPPPEHSGPSIFTAIQGQLGLKLEATKGPVEFIVIDHVERPSEN